MGGVPLELRAQMAATIPLKTLATTSASSRWNNSPSSRPYVHECGTTCGGIRFIIDFLHYLLCLTLLHVLLGEFSSPCSDPAFLLLRSIFGLIPVYLFFPVYNLM